MKHYVLTLWFCCILLVVSLSVQRSTVESDHYVAAVLEYNCDENTSVNLAAYVSYVAEAASQAVDVIVFPEETLNWNDETEMVSVQVTAPGRSAPCDDSANQGELLVKLSCAARLYAMYVVVNLRELMDCTESEDKQKCPEKKKYKFNTNVVFDRNGSIIDKYRKIHLYDEDDRTPSLDRALGVFTTDFGVTFGQLICFDLSFQVPAVQVVQKLGVTHIIYSTMWFSEGPFVTAVEIQEGYARALNVTLLASGANNINKGQSGSGIYSGSRGALLAYMSNKNGSRMLVAKVPKIPGHLTETYKGLIANDPASMDGLPLSKDPSLKFFASQLIEVQETVQILTVTQGDVTCNFEIITNTGRNSHADRQKYYYRAMAFDGVASFDGYATGGLHVCAVVACTTQALETCGNRFPHHFSTDTTLFNRLVITGTVPTPTRDPRVDAENIIYYPMSLQNNILPLSAVQLTYSVTRDGDNNTRVRLILEDPNVELLALAVWGRVFERDGQDPTGSNAHLTTMNIAVLLSTLCSAPILRLVRP